MSWWDFLFPKKCLSCGEVGEYVCADCLNRLQPIRETICPMCERPSMWGQAHARCLSAWGMTGLICVFPYAGVARKIVMQFKYKFVRDLLETMVELVISNGDWKMVEGKDLRVVGVPLHSSRERWRGFNQAECLGRRVATELGWHYQEKVLVRKRNTTPQMKLPGKERRKNLWGAFGVSKEIEQLRGKAILLVDDVWTTGATMRECTKVLRKAGVKEVYGLTFARVI
jgi:ComF family protein